MAIGAAHTCGGMSSQAPLAQRGGVTGPTIFCVCPNRNRGGGVVRVNFAVTCLAGDTLSVILPRGGLEICSMAKEAIFWLTQAAPLVLKIHIVVGMSVGAI